MTSGKIPPTIYYARVGLELSKLVARGQPVGPVGPQGSAEGAVDEVGPAGA